MPAELISVVERELSGRLPSGAMVTVTSDALHRWRVVLQKDTRTFAYGVRLAGDFFCEESTATAAASLVPGHAGRVAGETASLARAGLRLVQTALTQPGFRGAPLRVI